MDTRNDRETAEEILTRRQRVKDEVGNGNGFGLTLGMAVRLWPTPKAADANGAGEHGEGGPDLRTAVLWGTVTSHLRSHTPRKVDHGVVTDPPYGINWSRGPCHGYERVPGIAGDQDTTLRDQVLAAWSPRPAIVFGSELAPRPDQVRTTLYWLKPSGAGFFGSTTGFHRDVELIFLCGEVTRRTARWSSVLSSGVRNVGGPYSPAGLYGHPHAKPIDLLARLIDLEPGGAVFDPFVGSGSTLVAAKQLGRRAIGIEIEEQFCAVAAARLSQDVLFPGMMAVE